MLKGNSENCNDILAAKKYNFAQSKTRIINLRKIKNKLVKAPVC